MKNRQIVERVIPEKGKEWLLRQQITFYQLIASFVRDKKVLDAGCGCGLGSWIWFQNGAKLVRAYDNSREVLDFAKKNYKSPILIFEKLDFNKQKFPFKEFFDIACSLDVIEHLRNYQFYLKNIFLSLKKGGILFLTTPNANFSLGINKFHFHEFTPEELEQVLIEVGFKILERRSLSINIVSRLGGKYLPDFIVSLIKRMPFYSVLVRLFCRPKIENGTGGETLIYLIQK